MVPEADSNPASEAAASHGAATAVPAAAETVLECRGLAKTFKDFWLRDRVTAVRDLDLTVRAGEVFGLLGPNGSGKSTTIKMILGLLFPTAGSISIFGCPPQDVGVRARLGYLPEETDLYPFLNARETLDYYGRLFHLSRSERRRRSEHLLDMVGLTDVQERPIVEYSKGMQRRIGLAQALINDPDLLILDEPTNGLDPVGTHQVKELIVGLRKRGKTVLVSSHLLAEMEQICDRVVVMYGGSIFREGTLDALLTDDDALLLRTGPLKPEIVREVAKVLERHGESLRGTEHARQSLEALFLELVREAQVGGAATSGAAAGGGTARFLVDGECAGDEAEEN